jgi:protein phosphatase
VIPRERSHIHAAAITHPGMSGKNNEDNYAVSAHILSETDPTASTFAIVADGVGGHKAGEVASEIAVETISQIISESDASNPTEILEYAIVHASHSVHQQSAADDKKGMGSTCCCVWIIGNQLYTASVGDSRIYLIRDNQIHQITVDHTWIQEAIEHGILTKDQAKGHPRAHIIRRYLGSKNPVVPDFRLKLHPDETDEQSTANQGMRVLPNDQFLLCSDGLTDLVEDIEIQEVLQNNSLEAAIQQLVDLANERGGHDNITLITLKVPPQDSQPKTTEVKTSPIDKKKPKSQIPWKTIAIIGIFVIIASAIAVGAYLYFTGRQSNPEISPPTITLVDEQISSTISPPEEIVEPPTFTIEPTNTPMQATYTPWPTSTQEP